MLDLNDHTCFPHHGFLPFMVLDEDHILVNSSEMDGVKEFLLISRPFGCENVCPVGLFAVREIAPTRILPAVLPQTYGDAYMHMFWYMCRYTHCSKHPFFSVLVRVLFLLTQIGSSLFFGGTCVFPPNTLTEHEMEKDCIKALQLAIHNPDANERGPS